MKVAFDDCVFIDCYNSAFLTLLMSVGIDIRDYINNIHFNVSFNENCSDAPFVLDLSAKDYFREFCVKHGIEVVHVFHLSFNEIKRIIDNYGSLYCVVDDFYYPKYSLHYYIAHKPHAISIIDYNDTNMSLSIVEPWGYTAGKKIITDVNYQELHQAYMSKHLINNIDNNCFFIIPHNSISNSNLNFDIYNNLDVCILKKHYKDIFEYTLVQKKRISINNFSKMINYLESQRYAVGINCGEMSDIYKTISLISSNWNYISVLCYCGLDDAADANMNELLNALRRIKRLENEYELCCSDATIKIYSESKGVKSVKIYYEAQECVWSQIATFTMNGIINKHYIELVNSKRELLPYNIFRRVNDQTKVGIVEIYEEVTDGTLLEIENNKFYTIINIECDGFICKRLKENKFIFKII